MMLTPTCWTPWIEALARLDPESREIILLCDVMGLSQEEVGARLGLSLRETGQRLATARWRLQFSSSCEPTNA